LQRYFIFKCGFDDGSFGVKRVIEVTEWDRYLLYVIEVT